ncbi:MAG: ATP-binding protein, partial [Alphaproteobacteria bacterium]|nr:ATP-binding protein [Alphaproteobacteria bacterium]
PPVLFHRNALSRILHWILDNAIKFTEPGGKIWVAARELKDGGIEIWFKDTGAGIAADALDDVLKPFRQADGARSRLFEGVGLGLAMANSIATLHNSPIDLEGVGTTVVLTIPAKRVVPEGITAGKEDIGDGNGAAIASLLHLVGSAPGQRKEPAPIDQTKTYWNVVSVDATVRRLSRVLRP